MTPGQFQDLQAAVWAGVYRGQAIAKEPPRGGGGGLASPGRPTHPPTSEKFYCLRQCTSKRG